MTTPPKSPLVPTTPVTFAPSTMQADDLEERVEKPTAEPSTTSPLVGIYKPWQLENLQYAIEHVEARLEVTREDASLADVTEKLSWFTTAILPFTLQLDAAAPLKIYLSLAVPNALFRFLLESPEMYGEKIRHTGIYEATELDKDEFALVADTANRIQSYFPEARQLAWLHGRCLEGNRYRLPWVQVLTLPVDKRAFFVGVLKENDIEESTGWDLKDVINLRQVMDYAEKIGELEKTREYFDFLQGK